MLEPASVFLTGKMAGDRAFRADDHCAFNRNGEVFNKGAIFAGVAYDLALEVEQDIRRLVPDHVSMAQNDLCRILIEQVVRAVIPGAKTRIRCS